MTGGSDSSIASQVRRVAQNALALVTGGLVTQFAFTFLEILIARDLGADAYGAFVVRLDGPRLARRGFGTPFWTIQEGSRHPDRLPLLLGSSLVIGLFFFSVLYILLAVSSGAFAAHPVLGFLLVIMPYGLVLTVQQTLAAVYTSMQTMRVTALFQPWRLSSSYCSTSRAREANAR